MVERNKLWKGSTTEKCLNVIIIMPTYVSSLGSRNIVVYKQDSITFENLTYFSYNIVSFGRDKSVPF